MIKISNIRKTGVLHIILIAIVLAGCAKIVSPSGGDADKTAPQILGGEPGENSTQFSGNQIEIEFDEYVILDNTSDILISPFMETPPKFKLRGKKIIIEFEEELKPDLTYSINFGDNIKDLNQRNELKNFTYVFSTGEQLDSARVSGTALLASDGSKMENVVVGLYTINEDTLFKKEPPLYVAKTDKNGLYRIENIKDGTYELIALKDQNYNNYYDLPNEFVAFVDTNVVMKKSIPQVIDLMLFEESPTIQVINTETNKVGKVLVGFSQKLNNLTTRWLGEPPLEDSIQIDFKKGTDSLVIWYNYQNNKAQQLELLDFEKVIDTISFTKKLDQNPQALLFTTNLFKRGRPYLEAKKDLEFIFNYPLIAFDEEKIMIKNDSLGPLSGDSLNITLDRKKLIISYPWKTENQYTVEISPKTIQDFFGRLYTDTIQEPFLAQATQADGSLILRFTNKDSLYLYQYQLLDKTGDLLSEGLCEDSLALNKINPGSLELLIVEDKNRNGKWDSGNYLERRQAERIIRLGNPILIKSNFETEEEIDLGNL